MRYYAGLPLRETKPVRTIVTDTPDGVWVQVRYWSAGNRVEIDQRRGAEKGAWLGTCSGTWTGETVEVMASLGRPFGLVRGIVAEMLRLEVRS